MALMERNSNITLMHDKVKLNEHNNHNSNLIQEMNYEDKRNITSSRKNSAASSINIGSNGNPASTLSLSSTSSASSSAPNSKLDGSNALNQAQKASSKHNSSSQTPQTSRRPSGNSIRIQITSENNVNIDDMTEDSFPNMNDVEDECVDRDRDDAEDTTSNSTSNEFAITQTQLKHKKSKEKKKFVRSSAQQQHHLICQESEDLIDEQNQDQTNIEQPNEDIINSNDQYPTHNMNSAFDELFAAAETGNSSISAMIEAKMAVAAAQASNAAKTNADDSEIPFSIKNSSIRSRNGSFRSRNSGSSMKKSSSRTPPNDLNDSRPLLTNASNKRLFTASLKTDNYLGSPQQLTRSCSCKRPGSFKKMKSKHASPSRSPNLNDRDPANVNSNNSQPLATTPTGMAVTPTGGVSGRRGTQCSITILDDIQNQNKNRAGSLPFENLNNSQGFGVNNVLVDENNENKEVYRVRQFNVTTKGTVINRGDSFKRSFKRSTQSISSNHNKAHKENSSPTYLDTNTLNLPEYQEGGGSGSVYLNKSSNSSNYGINETSFIVDGVSANGSGNGGVTSNVGIIIENCDDTNPLVVGDQSRLQIAHPQDSQTYMVYIMGASSVGKNALIKQFKTSEYRGTYDISAQHSTDENEEGVSVMLDGVESRLQFISLDTESIKPNTGNLFEITKDNDAFIVVYSISDKASFHVAIDLLKNIRISENKNQPIILVGNKSDLVRKRSISREDGRNISLKYGCKFVETSVAINDRVDDLLAGILKQIRISEGTDLHQHNNGLKSSNKNYSDAHLHDLIKKSTNNTNTIFFKTNTLTRRLFKPKNHVSGSSNNKENYNSEMEKSHSLKGANGSQSSSFFQKLFNSLFKKKANQSQIQSVENLFTPPISLAKLKKNEK